MENKEQDFEAMKLFPIWKEKYKHLGVTPRELYMRQNGLCYLVQDKKNNKGDVVLSCTDGKDKAETAKMLNPTIECIACITNYTVRIIKESGKDES